MPYSLAILWRERNRFFPAVLAVAFSATLIATQAGVLSGWLAVGTRAIDAGNAHVWVASHNIAALGYGQPIPVAWKGRLQNQPEVAQVEEFILGFSNWRRPDGGMENCYVIGSRLEPGAVGRWHALTPKQRQALCRPGAVVVFRPELIQLGLHNSTEMKGQAAQQRIHVIAVNQEFDGAGIMPGISGSLRTARMLVPTLRSPSDTTYLIVRCHNPDDRHPLVQRLKRQYPDMETMTSGEFSWRTRSYWLTKSKAGLILGFSALLGLFVGGVITSQVMYAATVSSIREHAVLRALGVPRWRIRNLVLAQAFWVAVLGIGCAFPTTLAVTYVASHFEVEVKIGGGLVLFTAMVTLVMAMGSGAFSLRSLRLADPATLLR